MADGPTPPFEALRKKGPSGPPQPSSKRYRDVPDNHPDFANQIMDTAGRRGDDPEAALVHEMRRRGMYDDLYPEDPPSRKASGSEPEPQRQSSPAGFANLGGGLDVDDGAGLIWGLLLYAIGINFLRGGPAGVRQWLAAKFLNKTTDNSATAGIRQLLNGPAQATTGGTYVDGAPGSTPTPVLPPPAGVSPFQNWLGGAIGANG